MTNATIYVVGTQLNRDRCRGTKSTEKTAVQKSWIAEALESSDRNDMRRFYTSFNGSCYKTPPARYGQFLYMQLDEEDSSILKGVLKSNPEGNSGWIMTSRLIRDINDSS